MSRFVRSSKYRHVFGKAANNEQSYIGIKLTKTAWDSNYIKVNPQFLALCWETAGGGAVGVIPLAQTGKLATVTLISGHKGPVLDLDWNPFNDNLLATASEDCYVKIWNVPSTGIKENYSGDEAVQTLSGHNRKVGTTDFHPTANNILATSSMDFSVKIWDIEKGEEAYSISASATGIIQSLAWNYNGSLLAQVSKDKKLRVIDPRQSKITQETTGHEGVKGARCVWLGKKELIFTVGFSKGNQRQYSIWDPKDISKPLVSTSIDSSSGMLMPFYDDDTGCLFLAGKGDGNIRYYEITDDKGIIYPLSEYKSPSPTRGMASLPKRAVDVNTNEIVRLYKVVEDTIEPISFMVPRKSDMFAEDLFPDAASDEPALTAGEWIGGSDASPKTQSLAPSFKKETKTKTFEPTPQKQPTGPTTEAELKEEYEKLKKRVAYLEAELIKKEARIKELESGI
jgi:coronin-1B/1C/6